ncbi:hypothetical protein B296_00016203 [Ensete ventricosum]|uniref:Uncharacterized protein n=1 Tax=Ensete ventricosum TaxID=4639 RepID=A0A427B3V5_ENSVE|nr:hypothetical protein B296_00016203 [Ensete ventricosum]
MPFSQETGFFTLTEVRGPLACADEITPSWTPWFRLAVGFLYTWTKPIYKSVTRPTRSPVLAGIVSSKRNHKHPPAKHRPYSPGGCVRLWHHCRRWIYGTP